MNRLRERLSLVVGVAAALWMFSCGKPPTDKEDLAPPAWIYGRWTNGDWMSGNEQEVIRFDNDWVFERYRHNRLGETLVRGKFTVDGAVIRLEARLFASREALDYPHTKTLTVTESSQGIRLKGNDGAYEKVEDQIRRRTKR